MESFGRPVSKNSNKKHENVNVVLGSDSPSVKYGREIDANEVTEESEIPSSEQPLTPIKEKEAAKALGPNASPMTPWTVRSAQVRDPHTESGWSPNRAENPCSGAALEQGMGFTFAPNGSGKTVEISGDDAPSGAPISPSKAGSRRDPRSQSVRCLRFNASVDTVLAPLSAHADRSGPELPPRGALFLSSLQSNLGRVSHHEEHPHAESEEHCTNGSLDDDGVSIISKVSDRKRPGTGHYANGSVDEDGFSVARVSDGKKCGGTAYSANNGRADEVRVSVSDALREEAFVEETRISFLGAIVSKQYEDAGLNPPNGEAEDDSSCGSEQSVPTTPTTPSNQYISVPDTCPGAPLREGVRARLPVSDVSSVCRKLEF